MFSHVTVGTNELENAIAFYDALLGPLGLIQRPIEPDGGPAAACWIVPAQQIPRFYVYEPFNREPANAGNGVMVAFEAPSPAAVDAAYAAAMAHGGTDDGPPGLRPHYGKGYYGAYVLDPDGNKIHVVHRGDVRG